METIKKLIAKPAPWLYFILVVVLLIIVTNQAGTVKDLEADLSNANDEISASATLTESLSDEIAVRNDAIAGLESVIAGLEADSVAVNARLNDSDALRGELESTVANLESQLNASASALEDAIANPNCPVVTE